MTFRRHTKDRSLSPECTPLKHRYDSCFNLWFEGYLQPALDNDHARTEAYIPTAPTTQPIPLSHDTAPGPSKTPAARIITNWSLAFPSKPTATRQPIASETQTAASPAPPVEEPYVPDTKGKSRSEVKAEEYERRCGEAWRSYQTCLKVCRLIYHADPQKAVRQNQNLSTLLEQARQEHPLRDQSGLKGTVWDADYKPDA